MTNNYYQKHKEGLRKEASENIKIFLKNKRTKREKKSKKEQKQKLLEYMRNYYITQIK